MSWGSKSKAAGTHRSGVHEPGHRCTTVLSRSSECAAVDDPVVTAATLNVAILRHHLLTRLQKLLSLQCTFDNVMILVTFKSGMTCLCARLVLAHGKQCCAILQESDLGSSISRAAPTSLAGALPGQPCLNDRSGTPCVAGRPGNEANKMDQIMLSGYAPTEQCFVTPLYAS